MIDVLRANFPYSFQQETNFAGYKAFRENDGYLIVIPADYLDENVISEQHVISTFLEQSGFKHVATPIYTNHDTFIVALDEERSVYICHVYPLTETLDYTKVTSFLQQFHHAGQPFPYSPVYVNRYGKWKENWEGIIDQFEYIRQSFYERERLTKWERLWLESSFYFIGIGENAIQYLQESNQEKHFNQFDQPVFTLERIKPLLYDNFILPSQIVHDHPSRDIAELIRQIIIKEGKSGLKDVLNIIAQYHQKRPFSLFGLRLLYARLLFPIHFIDYSQEVFSLPQERNLEHEYLQQFLSFQREYEYCVHSIQKELTTYFQIDLPPINWFQAYDQK